MSLSFTVEARDGSARTGRILTPHGVIETPVFMPVGTVATVKAVPQQILEELGAQIILGNTYHLYLRPGHENIRKLGGLHRFMSWDRSILTDSGGFQVFSLSELRKISEEGVAFRSHLDGSSHVFTPEKSMEIQIALGADIIMAFDECTEHPAEGSRAKESMDLTLRWARRSQKYFEEHKGEVPWTSSGPNNSAEETGLPRRSAPRHDSNKGLRLDGNSGRGDNSLITEHQPLATDYQLPQTQSLFAIVQGGMYPDLRRECAERLVDMNFPGYAIGGLSVGEPRELTYETVQAVEPHLPKDKPRYLMGVGTPEEIVEYAGMGIDMMDCVLPTRAARHGLLFTSEGKVNIKNSRYALDESPLDSNCQCLVCTRYSRAYLRHLYSSGELLAQVLNTIHNVAFYLDTMKAVRHAIQLGEFSRFLSGVRARGLNSPAHT
ncbi:MAG TPA: tRNA guanosine(34) transglycosylase Tgt [Terriglobales bacterium]|nr:tRNA guanosine(34) transglycosylase Tgt [Terriglobales bacterium]